MILLRKASTILDLFLDNAESLTLEELSSLSGFNKPTTRRIALGLVECGFLIQRTKRGKYSLGMHFLDFSGKIKKNNSEIEIANPHLAKLSQIVNETVSMALWDGVKAALCQSFHADQTLKVVPDEGTRLGMHYSAIGKAISAELTEEELAHIFPRGLDRCTPNTITDFNELRRHLAIVRQEGVAFDDEEYYQGVRGIGAAIKRAGGSVVGAIGILGPSVRLTRAKLHELVPIIKSCAGDISRELGYR
jgi:DNA-binding IclR family transcriptional regulator